MMEYKEGSLIIGKVTMVRPYAVFLSFEDNVNGLLHISEISDAFIRDIDRYASIGDEIKVKIISIDPKNGFLRLSLKQVPEEERYSSHKNKRTKCEVGEDDFLPLKENLSKWIKNTLEEMEGNKNND